MSRATDLREIVDLLVRTAQGRGVTTAEPWNYGWSDEGYRRSVTAAMTHDLGRSVKLQPTAVDSFERAVDALLKIQDVRQRYQIEEFWGAMASLVGGLPFAATPEELATVVERRIKRIIDPPDSLVVFPVANVARPESMIDVGPILLGPFGEQFAERLRQNIGRSVLLPMPQQPWWMSPTEQGPDLPQPSPVLLAYTTRTQLDRAIENAGEAFEDLISLALMMQLDLDALSLYSLRGDANRPGIRGLVVDRQAFEKAAESDANVSREHGSQILVDGVFGQTMTVHWYSEKPFPLEQLLPTGKLSVAERLVVGTAAVHHRLRTAARWHAKAHWSADLADAVLALGICFDAMLSETGPSPGRVLSERFALLDPDRSQRRLRYRQFQSEYYPARSTVAHGAKSQSHDAAFVRGMAQSARWVFDRIVRITEMNGAASEAEYNDMYENLKWGESSGGGEVG
jgi:hypothetical protein